MGLNVIDYIVMAGHKNTEITIRRGSVAEDALKAAIGYFLEATGGDTGLDELSEMIEEMVLSEEKRRERWGR